ncbi:Tfp pilus assembly protein FimV [Chromobacterium violaceum]|uniref:Tfp pilus assembly protein FimV n=1 Tax=Chromobacterium violaceum TaxID=536 RepID=A0A447TFD2_CHRVL|nr:Tfp pilus assembly protein FimV [Chromobacterium violaceum]
MRPPSPPRRAQAGDCQAGSASGEAGRASFPAGRVQAGGIRASCAAAAGPACRAQARAGRAGEATSGARHGGRSDGGLERSGCADQAGRGRRRVGAGGIAVDAPPARGSGGRGVGRPRRWWRSVGYDAAEAVDLVDELLEKGRGHRFGLRRRDGGSGGLPGVWSPRPGPADPARGPGQGAQRQDLRYKLLEVLASQSDKAAFIEEAATAKRMFGKDSTMWQRVCELGRAAAPDHPLFEREAGAEPPSASLTAAAPGPRPAVSAPPPEPPPRRLRRRQRPKRLLPSRPFPKRLPRHRRWWRRMPRKWSWPSFTWRWATRKPPSC